jgi:hypothetical protein
MNIVNIVVIVLDAGLPPAALGGWHSVKPKSKTRQCEADADGEEAGGAVAVVYNEVELKMTRQRPADSKMLEADAETEILSRSMSHKSPIFDVVKRQLTKARLGPKTKLKTVCESCTCNLLFAMQPLKMM